MYATPTSTPIPRVFTPHTHTLHTHTHTHPHPHTTHTTLPVTPIPTHSSLAPSPAPRRLTSNESSGKDSAVLAKRVDELKDKLARSEEERLIKSEKYTTVLEKNHEVGLSDCFER